MPQDDASLSDQQTFSGGVQHTDPQSLGDELTFGGDGPKGEAPFDDEMEVVDLAARYTIESTLGQGGMGEVLLALDTRLNRKVAIKRILGDASPSRTAVKRFLTEAKSIAALNHSNIVQIHDYGQAADGPFLIMEYVDGKNLLDHCQNGALPLEEAVELTCQLCDGLTKAHEAGIIHRDIKPANVLMTKDGIPKLTDFGLAKAEASDTSRTMAGAVLGTLDFMSPEQRQDAALTDSRSDLWSLAATLYQLVTGDPPRVIDLESVPQQLRSTLSQALKSSKDARYQTAREFREALRASLTVNEWVPEVAVDLGSGECPQCHTRNDSFRKFCSKCAASLRVSCLSCSEEIPVWDKVCGECGGKQHDLVAARREELDLRREQAESLRGEYAFQEALRIAGDINAIEDNRLSHLKDWSKDFINTTQQEWDQQKENAAHHFAEAKTHRKAFDYTAALDAMKSIPDPMRTVDMSEYLIQLQADYDESLELIKTISARVAKRDLEELLEQVTRACELRGDREDLQKLKRQLSDRQVKLIRQRDEGYAEAERLLGRGKAKEALNLIQGIRLNELTSPQKDLKTRLQEIVEAEKGLMSVIKEAKEDGVIDPEEVVTLFPLAIKYLDLNPNHARIRKLHDDLILRLPKCPSSVLSQLPAKVLAQLPDKVQSEIHKVNSIGMELRLIPAGKFMMGKFMMGVSYDRYLVKITKSYFLGIFPVTQKEYKQVMGSNPSRFKGSQNPVEMVSWKDAAEFCRKLSALPKEQRIRRRYRLPTEAEWEYACRAGTTSDYSFGDKVRQLSKYAWYVKNSGESTHPVGQKKPNPWGLYDMLGNVYEWCSDWYGKDYYDRFSGQTVENPSGPSSGSSRVLRGGSWNNNAKLVRSDYRNMTTPDVRVNRYGFRVVCELY